MSPSPQPHDDYEFYSVSPSESIIASPSISASASPSPSPEPLDDKVYFSSGSRYSNDWFELNNSGSFLHKATHDYDEEYYRKPKQRGTVLSFKCANCGRKMLVNTDNITTVDLVCSSCGSVKLEQEKEKQNEYRRYWL
jgi:DNA-directed RNA polymerase subunit RPC12/RpoP